MLESLGIAGKAFNQMAILSIIAYTLVLGSAATLAAAAWRAQRLGTYTVWFLLSLACLLGGFWLAAFVTPDWSPLTMLAAYIPFLALGIVAALQARRVANQSEAAIHGSS